MCLGVCAWVCEEIAVVLHMRHLARRRKPLALPSLLFLVFSQLPACDREKLKHLPFARRFFVIHMPQWHLFFAVELSLPWYIPRTPVHSSSLYLLSCSWCPSLAVAAGARSFTNYPTLPRLLRRLSRPLLGSLDLFLTLSPPCFLRLTA